MDLFDRLEAASTQRSAVCTLCAWLAGLSPTAREDWRVAINTKSETDDGKVLYKFPGTAIAKIAEDFGAHFTEATVGRHRRGGHK